jgi:hypothetical protein
MRERRERDEAARLDGFLAQIRTLIKDTPRPQERRAEIEGMLAAAEKTAGPRPAVETLRAECFKRFEEAGKAEQAAPLVAQVEEALLDARRLRQRRKEIEGLISEVEKAGARTVAEDLRARAAKAFEEADRRGDLLGHWRLDGDARDSSGLGFHGKLKGTKTVPGKIGQALWFNGEDDVVDLPNSPELDRIQEESYTVMAWFRPEDVPPGVKEEDNKSWYTVVIKQGMHIGLSYKNSRQFEMGHWGARDTRAIAMTEATFPPGSWYHLAGVVDRPEGKTRIHVNGVMNGTTPWPAGLASRPFGRIIWRIGHAGPGWKEWAWPAKGTIDDVRFYCRAFAAEEVRRIYEAGLAGRDP